MHQENARPFAVFDVDGTLIRWQLYHAIVNQLIKQGDISRSAGQQIHEARMVWKRRSHDESFREYEQTLVDIYNAALAELSPEHVTRATDAVFAEYRDQVNTYTRELMRDLKGKGYLLFAISGSPQEVVDKLAEYYGFDDVVGQQYEQIDGKYTGKHEAAIAKKDAVLRQLITKHGATMNGSVAIGDSESDATMLQMVERPIAFNPTRGLAAIAKSHGWPIVIERKNMVYQLELHNGSYVLADTDER